MEFELDKINAIKDLFKPIKGTFYKETYLLINKFLNGEIKEDSVINNDIIAKILDIDKTKASKILSELYKNGFITKSISPNIYKVPNFIRFKYILLDKLKNILDEYEKSINLTIDKDFRISFSKYLDVLTGYKTLVEVFNNSNLEWNLYYISLSSEFSTSIPFNKFSIENQKIIKTSLSKTTYNFWHMRYLLIKNRLEKIYKNNIENGITYYIVNLRIMLNYYKSKIRLNNISNNKIRKYLILMIESFIDTLKNFKKYFDNNKLFVLIDTESYYFTEPLTILGPHVFRLLRENFINPTKFSVLYIYDKYIAEMFAKSYMELFNSSNEIQKFRNEFKAIPPSVRAENLGPFLYEHAIKALEKELANI